jgi:predicted site-specific integrase-resolvase
MTPKQATEFSRVSRAVLRRWEREGKVRLLRTALGGHRRYLESELLAAMLGRRRPEWPLNTR